MSGTSECRIPAKRKERMMAELSTSIQVNADLSSIIKNMSNAVSLCAGSFGSLEDAADHVVDTGQFLMAGAALDRMEYEAQSYKENIVAATMQQEEMNQSIQAGEEKTNGLLDKIEGIASSYLKLDTLKKVFNIADNLAQTTAGLNAIAGSEAEVLALQDQIYDSAQRSRTSYLDMADTVTKLSLESGGVFANNQEAIVFAENLNKSFAIAGASQQEISSATAQVTKALGAGVLRSEELNTLFGSAPGMIQHMADYLGVNTQQLREMAAEGELTADVIKNAMLSATDEIDEQLAATPMTWAQVWTNAGNKISQAFDPVLSKISNIAQSEEFAQVADSLAESIQTVAAVADTMVDWLVKGASFIVEHWDEISPVIYGVVAAIGVYAMIQAISAVASMINTLSIGILAIAYMAMGLAVLNASVFQTGLNMAMAAFPGTWIIAIIAGIIVAVGIFISRMNDTGVTAGSVFASICGGINVVLQFFKNLAFSIANLALGIWNSIGAIIENMKIAFHNAIFNIKAWFYNLLSSILHVVAGIAEALNSIPFIEFDYGGLIEAADEYEEMASAAKGQKQDYVSIKDTFDDGASTYNVFQEGWSSDAYETGYNFGEGVAEKAKNLFSLDNITSLDENVASTAENTGRMADSMELSEEEMKYLRDIAEREVIDRTVFSSISVDMGGVTNTVSNMADLDNIPQYLVNTIQRQMEVSAEGVHTDV